MKLYICEKRSQANDIAAVLGITSRNASSFETRDGTVTWAIGHLLELAEPQHYNAVYEKWNYADLPILPQQFALQEKTSTKQQYKAVKALIKEASSIVIATDADREGEMIARELLEHVRYRGPIERLWLSALDPESIRNALTRIRKGAETENLYYAALARSQSDWLVGMNMSRAVTLRCQRAGSRDFVSIGRVQTPTLKLVVQRDREIESFVSRNYFEIVAKVLAGSERISLRHAPDGEERIFDRATADAIAQSASGFSGPLTVTVEMKRKAPPKLFSLSGFQTRANAAFGWSADDALKIAQSLYETHKVTTYPRTDCEFLPEEQIADIEPIVSNLLALPEFSKLNDISPQARKSVFNTAKITAHHAIIPTKVAPDLSRMSAEEREGFLLIARSYLAALMPDYEYESTTIRMNVPTSSGETEFSATGNVPKVPGWKSVYSDADEDSATTTLPRLENGSTGLMESAEVDSKKTQPLPHYTEGTLIQDMKSVAKFVTDPVKKSRLKESSGIGTEATRASILKTLKTRGFLEVKGKKIISTEKGRSLIELLEKHLPPLADPGETAVWEESLEEIAEGRSTHTNFVSNIGKRISEYIATLSGAVAAPAPTPAHSTTSCTYKDKPVLDGGSRWIFEAVKGFFPKEMLGRPMSVEDYISVLDATDTLPSFDGFTSKKGAKFSAMLKFNPNKKFDGRPSPGVDLVFSPRSETPEKKPARKTSFSLDVDTIGGLTRGAAD
jgi:DNA topoisomerase-3